MAVTQRRKRSPKKLSPLQIKGSKLEDFLPLLPAEEALRQCSARGEECIVTGFCYKRPEAANKQNTLRAEFLRFMILGGCENTLVHVRGINLTGAFITTENTLDLEATNVCKDLRLHHCHIDGNVLLNGATLNNVSLQGTLVTALVAERATFAGNLNLEKNFTATDSIRLSSSTISGNLLCDGAHFLEGNNSLIANRSKISGDVDLENVIAKGTIALTGTEIGGDFTPQAAVLQLRNTKIGGTLVWRSLKFANGEVDFSGASCKTINTDGDSWMRKRESYMAKRDDGSKEETKAEDTITNGKRAEFCTKLDNFTYEGFSNLPDNCKPEFWIEFLNQQPEDHLKKNFKPRPWEHLAGVLDTMGYEEEALELRIEKQRHQTHFMINHEPAAKNGINLWHWGRVAFRRCLWGPLVGFGYKPGNALVYLFALVVLGGLIYGEAAKRGIMTPTHPLIFKEARSGGSIPAWCAENWVYFPDENCTASMPSEYSEFEAFIYAADVALPVVNLRMEVDWAPRVVYTDGTRDNFGWWVRTYEWFLIAAGWILSLLFVSAVGSSIRK